MKFMNKEDFPVFEKSEKLGIVGTIDDRGDPHLTLLTTIMAKSETELLVGQFAAGLSKENMRQRKKCGFAIMDLDLSFWTGTMDWTHSATEGEEFIHYNNMPMWRFNTYFGIYEVHYFDLHEIGQKNKLDIPKVAVNAIKAMAKKPFLKKGSEKILRPYAVKLFDNVGNPKFLSFINEEGYPVVVPVVQAQQANTDTVVLSAEPYGEMMAGLQAGQRVAVMALSTAMESVVIKGTFSGFKGGMATIAIDRVYNSIPPVMRYIYPFDDFTEPRI